MEKPMSSELNVDAYAHLSAVAKGASYEMGKRKQQSALVVKR
jgi:hypothetical protein